MSDVIATAVQLAIGLIFVQAAVGKVQAWHEFKGILGAYELLPPCAVPSATFVVVTAESLTGMALLTAWKVSTAASVAAGLFILFAAAMAVNLIRGRTSLDCGCFQSARQPLEWRLVIRNLVAAAAVLVASPFTLAMDDPARWIHAVPAGIALFAIYIALNAVWALDGSRAAAFSRS